MSSEDEKVDSKVKYAWRPATRGDIGSVARFRLHGTTGNRDRDWYYGILKSISRINPFVYRGPMVCECDLWDVCEIQYVADENP